MNYSDWQPMSVKPEVSGVYQRKNNLGTYYSCYLAETDTWYYGSPLTPDHARTNMKQNQVFLKELYEYNQWRGILEE